MATTAACQFQKSYYPNYTRNSQGSYTSSASCVEPEMTTTGLTDTERNKQTQRYKRDQRVYSATQQPLAMYRTCSKDPSSAQCAHIETLERTSGQTGSPQLRDGYWQKTGQGPVFTYNTYGKANAAFERIHLKEGNSETGYLKINNPPNMFRGAGRYYDHFTETTEKDTRRYIIEEGTHDERLCAMGMDDFCQGTAQTNKNAPGKYTFKQGFYRGRTTEELPETTEQGLNNVTTPGQSATNMGNEYRKARGYM